MNEPISSQNPETRRVIARIRELRENKDFDEAEALGEISIKRHPADTRLLAEHADTAIRRKNWGAAIKRLKRASILIGPALAGDAVVLKLAAVYVALGQTGEAGAVLDDALATRPGSITLRKAAAEFALLVPERRFDGECWRALAAAPELRGEEGFLRISVLIACVAGLRLAGENSAAEALLLEHYRVGDPHWEEQLKDGYGRLVVFDNGRTRVEFHTKFFDPATGLPAVARQLAITFDVMEQTWEKEPFGYRPLSPGFIDLLAVRKRTKEDFHQELRREDFLSFAGPIAARYGDVVALGQSLGAYSALYYASWIPGCRILATAPRNPLHPRYAGKRYASYKLFAHDYEMPLNEVARPTIVFDPKNPEDARYVRNSLALRFPNAELIPYPYCGHSITRYLRDVGGLKSATLGFCDGLPFPPFDRSKRGSSAEYLRNLSRVNLRGGRTRRALALALKALEMGQETERTRELLAKIDPEQTWEKRSPGI